MDKDTEDYLHQILAMIDRQQAEIKELTETMEAKIKAECDYQRHMTLQIFKVRDEARDRQFAYLEEENDTFRRQLGKYAMLERGEMPHVADLTKIGCQVWHTPELTKDQQRQKSIWSLRLNVSVRHHRIPEAINVRLFPLKEFMAKAQHPKYRKQAQDDADVARGYDAIMTYCSEAVDFSDRIWAGFVQSFTDGGGRPYCIGQAAFLLDHDADISPGSDRARVDMVIGGHTAMFGMPKPAAGGEGSALWYLEWKPTKS